MPSKVMGSTIGLTGVFDGDQENDFTYLNGTGHISINSTEMEIFDWASTCKYQPVHLYCKYSYISCTLHLYVG